MTDASFTSSNLRQISANPTTEHEEFIRLLRDIIDEAITSRLPTMGTVTGVDGGTVKVHVDDEDEPRQLGMPRKVGSCYRPDDRVLLIPNRAGELMVAGVISSEQNKPAVTDTEIVDVSGGKVIQNSMPGNKLVAGSVDTNRLADGAITNGKLAGGSVTGDKIAANAVGGNELSAVIKKKIDEALTAAHLDPYVKSNDLAEGAIGNDDLATQDWVTSKNYITGGGVRDNIPPEYVKKTDLNKNALKVNNRDVPLATEQWVKDNFAPKPR